MEGPDMMNVVVPVCDSRNDAWVIEQVIGLHRQMQARVHLLNVQPSLPRHVSRFFSAGQLHDFHQENAMRVLAPIVRSLDVAGVPHKVHVKVGRQAETIVRFAREYECRRIVIEESAEGWMSALGLGSISSQVRHLAHASQMSIALGGA